MDSPLGGTPDLRGNGGETSPASRTTGRALYLIVHQALREELLQGRWSIGGSLPSEFELSAQFNVSRITIRHAMRLLEAEGFIRKARARRAVVVTTTPKAQSGWMVESIDDIIAMVGNAKLRIESWRKETSAGDAKLFGLPAGTRLHCLRGVLVRDDTPYTRSTIYFSPHIGAQLSRDAFDDPVVFRVLQRELGIRLDDVRLTIWAELARAEDAAVLGCDLGAALLVMQLSYYEEGGALVEVAYSRSLASEARLSTRLTTRPRAP